VHNHDRSAWECTNCRKNNIQRLVSTKWFQYECTRTTIGDGGNLETFWCQLLKLKHCQYQIQVYSDFGSPSWIKKSEATAKRNP